MSLELEAALGQMFLCSFPGKVEPPPDLLQVLRTVPLAGVELFRHKNFGTKAETRALTDGLQRTAADAGHPSLLIAANQEGGQLISLPESTPFPGNMALGATRSEALSKRVGRAIGLELAAVGINVDMAPVVDVNNNPANPVIGTRAFGDDPRLVGRLGAAMIRGIQSAGVAATAKHFPGHGDTAVDSHLGLPLSPHALARLKTVELPPFHAAVKAGAKLIMTAHVALPKITGRADLPASLSAAVVRGLLRKQLRYRGIVVTDAMDMHALDQGPGLVIEAIAAIAAGSDLVLFHHDLAAVPPAFAVVRQAVRRGFLDEAEIRQSARRLLALKQWLRGQTQPPLAVVACAEHQALAREVAAQSMTLVRDRPKQLPLRLPDHARIAALVPQPTDLTAADTSSYEQPALGAALRRHHPRVDEFVIAMNPSAADVAELASQVAGYDLVVVGTINATAHPGQAALVNVLLARETPVVTVALRLPYDLATYPSAGTYLCTYSILGPSLEALADALWSGEPFPGRVPVRLPHGLAT